MNFIISLLIMSATIGLFSLFLFLIRPLTDKILNGIWHYRIRISLIVLLIIPVGICLSYVIPTGLLDLTSEIGQSSAQGIASNMIISQNNATVEKADDLYEISKGAANFNRIYLGIIVLWAIGFMTFVAYKLIRFSMFNYKIKKTSLLVDDESACRILIDIKKQLKIKQAIQMSTNEFIRTPMSIGLFRPHLYLPEISIENEELNVIIRHELFHINRKDILVKYMSLVANALHWFNPLVYLLMKEINYYCEISCDELVIKNMNMNERRFYGETILNVLCRVVDKKSGAYVALCESRKGIEHRLAHMLNFKKDTKKSRSISAILTVVCSLLIVSTTGCAYSFCPLTEKGNDSLSQLSDTKTADYSSQSSMYPLSSVDQDIQSGFDDSFYKSLGIAYDDSKKGWYYDEKRILLLIESKELNNNEKKQNSWIGANAYACSYYDVTEQGTIGVEVFRDNALPKKAGVIVKNIDSETGKSMIQKYKEAFVFNGSLEIKDKLSAKDCRATDVPEKVKKWIKDCDSKSASIFKNTTDSGDSYYLYYKGEHCPWRIIITENNILNIYLSNLNQEKESNEYTLIEYFEKESFKQVNVYYDDQKINIS